MSPRFGLDSLDIGKNAIVPPTPTPSMSATQAIVSLGQACCHLQQMPDVVRRVAAELQVEPVARVNYIDHYSEADVEKIASHLQAKRA